MSEIYVIDTETATARGDQRIMEGHIVEIGVVRVSLENMAVQPVFSAIVKYDSAYPDSWVFRNSSLRYDDVMSGHDVKDIDETLGHRLSGCVVTAYNTRFDKAMIERDMPYLASRIQWADDLMECASKVEGIPKNHAGGNQYPTAEAAYNGLCPDDPCHLNGHELHRAVSDAEMEGYVLLELFKRGLWEVSI